MDQEHAHMWAVVDEPEEVPAALANASAWSRDAMRFANVRS
jgi:hypothetical protein